MKNALFSTKRLLFTLLLLLSTLCLYFCGTVEVPDAGTVNIRMEASPKTLNPIMPATGYDLFVSARIFQTLGGLNPETNLMEPMILKSIPKIVPVTEGPKKGLLMSECEIMDEAMWDNGSPITANDVVFTLKLVFHPGLATQLWRGYFEYLHSIEVDPANPKKFKVYFKQYYILAMESLCQTPIYPIYNYDPQNLLKDISLDDLTDTSKTVQMLNNPTMKAFADEFNNAKFKNDKTAISGSGPYKMESMGDQLITLVKKDNWWGDKLADKFPQLGAYPTTLNYQIVKADEALENMLRTGEIDIAASVNPTKFLEWKKDAALSAKYDFVTHWTPTFNRLQINMQNPKLSDKRVRQALAYSIDYDYIVSTINQGFGKRTVSGPVNPAQSFYAKDVPLYNFDIPKAKALLAEAGWTDTDGDGTVDKMINGRRTPLELTMNSTNSAKVAELTSNSIKQSAQQAGFKITIVSVDISENRAKTIKGEYDVALYAGVSLPGLVDFYQQYYSGNQSPAGDNRCRFANSRADSLIVAIRTTEDEAKRNALYVEMQALLHEEVPEVYLYAPDQRIIVAKKFNYVLSADRPGYFENMFKLKK